MQMYAKNSSWILNASVHIIGVPDQALGCRPPALGLPSESFVFIDKFYVLKSICICVCMYMYICLGDIVGYE